jgi:hypothetical protein
MDRLINWPLNTLYTVHVKLPVVNYSSVSKHTYQPPPWERRFLHDVHTKIFLLI